MQDRRRRRGRKDRRRRRSSLPRWRHWNAGQGEEWKGDADAQLFFPLGRLGDALKTMNSNIEMGRSNCCMKRCEH
jgi:hypothetical protein